MGYLSPLGDWLMGGSFEEMVVSFIGMVEDLTWVLFYFVKACISPLKLDETCFLLFHISTLVLNRCLIYACKRHVWLT